MGGRTKKTNLGKIREATSSWLKKERWGWALYLNIEGLKDGPLKLRILGLEWLT